jgi:flagellar motor switch protein FliG
LRRACRDGEQEATALVRASVPRLSDASDQELAKLSLSDAQHTIARDCGFDSWPKLKLHLDGSEDAHTILLGRVVTLVGERTEDARKVLRRLLSEDPNQAAAVAIGLGQETASELMKLMSDAEMEAIAEAVGRLDVVTTEDEDEAFEVFEQMLVASKYFSSGGLDYAEGALAKAIGGRKARAILRRIKAQRDAVIGRLVKLAESDPDACAQAFSSIDPEDRVIVMSEMGSALPESIPGSQPVLGDSEQTEHSNEDILDALEVFERLAVTYRYVYREGMDFARGALEKSMGPEKTRTLLNLAVAGSGLLRVNALIADDASEILQTLSPQQIAAALSRLESSKALEILGALPGTTRDAVSPLFGRVGGSRAVAQLDRELSESISG